MFVWLKFFISKKKSELHLFSFFFSLFFSPLKKQNRLFLTPGKLQDRHPRSSEREPQLFENWQR